MATITKIVPRMIYDSRGFPTTEVDLYTRDGMFRAACPSGASTGSNEALELRDGGAAWMGKGVTKAIAHIRDVLAPAVLGMDVTNQAAIDAKLQEVDGTETFGRLGANAALPISMAACRAGAAAKHMPLHTYIAEISGRVGHMRLPVPCFNIINGGKHAGNKLAPQEYMVAPFGATTFHEAMRMGAEVYHHLKRILQTRFGIEATAVGDEGGFAPPLDDPRQPLEVIVEAITAAGLTGKMGICLDLAASEFYIRERRVYNLNFKGTEERCLTGEEFADMMVGWCRDFPIISIEDPFDEEDFESFSSLLAKVHAAGLKVQIVGDDLTVSQESRVRVAIERKACDALLLKINQVGTITGAIRAANVAMAAGWHVMVSHRSGETEDSFIAPLVVGLGTGQIKTGAPCRSERLAKYNELLRIEESLTGTPYGCTLWQ